MTRRRCGRPGARLHAGRHRRHRRGAPRLHAVGANAGRPVVLVFYPGDNTPVCTRQLNSYTAEIDALPRRSMPRSWPSAPSLSRATTASAPTRAASRSRCWPTSTRRWARAYGVLGPVGFYRRSVFVVDAEGAIRHAHRAVAGLWFRPTDELVARRWPTRLVRRRPPGRPPGGPGHRGVGASEPVFVLGIDPGLSRCGYGVVERIGAVDPRAVAAGVLRTDPARDVAAAPGRAPGRPRGLLAEHRPAVVAVERVLFQVNARTAIPVAPGRRDRHGRGGGVPAAEVVEYSPNQVKQAVAGSAGPTRTRWSAWCRRCWASPRPLRPADAADAVALALCHLAHAPLGAGWRRALGAGVGAVIGSLRGAAARPGRRRGAGRGGRHRLPGGVAHDGGGAGRGRRRGVRVGAPPRARGRRDALRLRHAATSGSRSRRCSAPTGSVRRWRWPSSRCTRRRRWCGPGRRRRRPPCAWSRAWARRRRPGCWSSSSPASTCPTPGSVPAVGRASVAVVHRGRAAPPAPTCVRRWPGSGYGPDEIHGATAELLDDGDASRCCARRCDAWRRPA